MKPKAEKPAPVTDDSGVKKALSKASRRIVAQQEVIDALLEKQGGLRHKIKNLQKFIAKLKEDHGKQQGAAPSEPTGSPQGANEQVASRGQGEAEAGWPWTFGQPAPAAGEFAVGSGSVAEPQGYRAAQAVTDAEIEAAIEGVIDAVRHDAQMRLHRKESESFIGERTDKLRALIGRRVAEAGKVNADLLAAINAVIDTVSGHIEGAVNAKWLDSKLRAAVQRAEGGA